MTEEGKYCHSWKVAGPEVLAKLLGQVRFTLRQWTPPPNNTVKEVLETLSGAADYILRCSLGQETARTDGRIGNIRSGHAASADTGHDADDNHDGGDGDNDADNGHSDGADAYRAQDSAIKVSCRICGYQWQPKRKPEEIRQCPRCNSRKRKRDDAA